jgi:hypothetical protein
VSATLEEREDITPEILGSDVVQAIDEVFARLAREHAVDERGPTVGNRMAHDAVLVRRGVHGVALRDCKSATFMAMWIGRGRSYT